MCRLFNLRQGLSDEDDKLTERFFQPAANGALTNTKLDAERMDKAKRWYYGLMGWDNRGVPDPAKLEELEIG